MAVGGEAGVGMSRLVAELVARARTSHARVLARADLLSDSAQHVLRVASAAARWVSDWLLMTVAQLPAPDLVQAENGREAPC